MPLSPDTQKLLLSALGRTPFYNAVKSSNQTRSWNVPQKKVGSDIVNEKKDNADEREGLSAVVSFGVAQTARERCADGNPPSHHITNVHRGEKKTGLHGKRGTFVKNGRPK